MKKIFILFGAMLLLIGLGFGVSSLLSQQPSGSLRLLFTPINGSSVRITDTANKIDITAKNNTAYELQPGTYRVLVSGNNITAQNISVSIEEEPVTEVVTISYTDTFLSTKLIDELPAIQKVLSSAYPEIQRLYVIKSGYKLYLDGSWFTARFRYVGTDDATRDTLKLVMNKKDGVWTVVTKPPQIIVSKKSYPSIPRIVINDINSDEVVKTLGQ